MSNHGIRRSIKTQLQQRLQMLRELIYWRILDNSVSATEVHDLLVECRITY
ncbi:MAG: hypothetical protein ABGW96_02185 [Methylophilaceae bacterium]